MSVGGPDIVQRCGMITHHSNRHRGGFIYLAGGDYGPGVQWGSHTVFNRVRVPYRVNSPCSSRTGRRSLFFKYQVTSEFIRLLHVNKWIDISDDI